MTTFLDDDFLLQTRTARRLYHDYAAELPIIDYHNHLPPADVAGDRRFADITAAWLEGDHYKWRALRANGIDERFVTGDADGREKFRRFAATVPQTLRNPLYHWTHLELQRYFGVKDLLNADNADAIYDVTSRQLQQPSHTARALLRRMKVDVVCTTDHPTDSLEHHRAYRPGPGDPLLLPTFRPDKFLDPTAPAFAADVGQLGELTGTKIDDYAALRHALLQRLDYFAELGCRLSDHGLPQLYAVDLSDAQPDHTLREALAGDPVDQRAARQFQTQLLLDLGREYARRGWTMQLHLGPQRNNSSRLLARVGADAGADSIGDRPQAEGLAYFLNELDRADQLPKTILYNLNPRDNHVFATMAGNFNDGSVPGKVQWGSAWWFLDQKDGMEEQLNVLSNTGLLSRFVGMLTDSRSFLSFPRHEYFRRILCNLLGNDVEQGLLPNDEQLLGELVGDVCYHNARRHFDFQPPTPIA